MTLAQKNILDAVKQVFGIAASDSSNRLYVTFAGDRVMVTLYQPQQDVGDHAFVYDHELGWGTR